LSVLSDIVVDSVTQSAKEATEFYMYYTSTTKSFQSLIDLFDPRPCLSQFQRTKDEVKCVLQGHSKEMCIRLTELQDSLQQAQEAVHLRQATIGSLTGNELEVESKQMLQDLRMADERLIRVKEHENKMACDLSGRVNCDWRITLPIPTGVSRIVFQLAKDPS
jgi:hypothetical protein